jgi:hypothetical protein
MTATKPKCGFYANDTETYYVTPSGRIWIVTSEDDLPDVAERVSMPDDATLVDELLTPDECVGYCRQIEAVSSEKLIAD